VPRGGKREGAGRPAGVQNSKTVARLVVAEQAQKAGVTPVDIMYKNMLIWDRQADSAEVALAELTADAIKGMKPEAAFDYLLAQVQKTVSFRQLAQKAAADLGPYKHPKLAAVMLQGDENKPVVTRVQRVVVYPKERQS
jgi:hypothetical protein